MGTDVDTGADTSVPCPLRQAARPVAVSGVAMSDPIVLDSLQRRIRAMHSLYFDALSTMDIDQVNHFEREGVLPIAFSLFHIVNMIDVSFMLMTGTPPIWNDDWERRIHPAISDHGKHRTVDEMVGQRIGDYDEFQAYLRAVFSRTEEWLDHLDPAEFDRVVVARPFPRRSPAPTAPGWPDPKGITLLDATECWIYQHGLRHMGEIELARGLVGLGGMTS